MELIPILSLIILVATISTFILAVGAYILYKIRERKGTQQAPQPSSIPAELIAPTPVIAEQHTTGTGMRRTYDRTVPTRERRGEYDSGQRERRQGPEMKPTYVSSPPPTNATYSTSAYRHTAPGESGTTAERKKFLRYTSEGYVEPASEKKKKKDKEDQLKWR